MKEVVVTSFSLRSGIWKRNFISIFFVWLDKTLGFLLLDWFPTKTRKISLNRKNLLHSSADIPRVHILLRAPDSIVVIYVSQRFFCLLTRQESNRDVIFFTLFFGKILLSDVPRVSRYSHMIMWFKSVSDRICWWNESSARRVLNLSGKAWNSPRYHLTHYYVIRSFVPSTWTAKCLKEDFQGGNKNSAGYFLCSLDSSSSCLLF